GGWSGEMCRHQQPASASAPATRALAVVVDPTVGVYEPSNAPFIEVVEGVDARPGRERDARFHRGIGRKDNVLVIPLDDLLQLLGELGALAVVLHHPTAAGASVDSYRGRPAASPSSPAGGSVWESNPPPACLEPDTGFEVREAHRVPRRFRSLPECTILARCPRRGRSEG